MPVPGFPDHKNKISCAPVQPVNHDIWVWKLTDYTLTAPMFSMLFFHFMQQTLDSFLDHNQNLIRKAFCCGDKATQLWEIVEWKWKVPQGLFLMIEVEVSSPTTERNDTTAQA